MGQPAVLLTPKELATRWDIAVGTLANQRARGDGPPFVKIGSRVRYQLTRVIEWEASHEHLVPANDNQNHTEPEN